MEDIMEKIKAISAIRTFFNTDGYRPVDIGELKELSADEKKELGRLCAKALGKELEE
jgi:hypothetical protein